ncbi:MAG: hypothetical protein P1P89_04315 [Desulfobacterales bacterium]|nr:hypothetical protein [Desulfobacterales bacterium]
MKENGLGVLFVRHLVMAIPWGVIFLVVMLITSIGIKQQIKEGVQYAIRTGIQESASFAYNYQMVVPVKKNIKEGIEFVAKTAGHEIRAFLQDPQVKQDIKEAMEYGGKKMR